MVVKFLDDVQLFGFFLFLSRLGCFIVLEMKSSMGSK